MLKHFLSAKQINFNETHIYFENLGDAEVAFHKFLFPKCPHTVHATLLYNLYM